MVKSFFWLLPIPVSPSPYSLLPSLFPTPNSYSSSVPYSQLLLISTYSLLPAHNLLLSHSFPYSPFSLLPISTLFLVTPRSLLPTYSPPVPYSWLLPVPCSPPTPYLYHTPGYSLFHSPNKLPTCTILLVTPCSLLPTCSLPEPYSWLLPVPFSPLAPYLNPTPGYSLFPSSLLLVTPCSLLSLLPTTYLNSTPIYSMFLCSHLHPTPILLANTTAVLELALGSNRYENQYKPSCQNSGFNDPIVCSGSLLAYCKLHAAKFSTLFSFRQSLDIIKCLNVYWKRMKFKKKT